jgi:hypothetical protein
VAKSALRVADFQVGVRSNSRNLDRVLKSVLREHVVDDPAVPPNFSLVEGETRLRGSRPAYGVQYRCAGVFSTVSLPRAVAVLIGLIDQVAMPSEHPTDVLELDAVALVGVQGAVLAPWTLRYRRPGAESRLFRDGIRVLERSSVHVDINRRAVMVTAPRLTLNDTGTDPLVPAGSVVSEMTPPGAYPISAWLFHAAGAGLRQISRADALAEAMGIAYRHGPPVSNLTHLAALLEGIELLGFVDESSVGGLAIEALSFG